MELPYVRVSPKSRLGSYLPTAFVSEGALLIVLKSYFDRSGQEDAAFMTLSGIAATDEMWGEIEENWLGILRLTDPKATYMHMVEAVPLRGEFSKDKGWDDDKVSGIINSLISYLSMIPKDKYYQIACTIDMTAYRKLLGESYQLDSPVDICNECCVERMMHWYLFEYKGGFDVEASYYFDQGEPFEPVFRAKWNRELVRASELNEYTIWSHIKHVGEAIMRDTPGLQVADMLAWANNREESKVSKRYEVLALAMKRLMPSKWITWDEAKLRKIYRPLISKPYGQEQY